MADEVRPDHLEGEPGLGEPKNPGGADRELRVVSVDIANLRTGSFWRTSQNAGGSFSSIQHHRPCNSSHLSFVEPSGYAPLALGIQATQASMAPPFWIRGEK